MDQCTECLAQFLAGPVFKNAEVVRKAATAQGFTRGRLSTARKVLGVATISDSQLHNGEGQNWFWLIPKNSEAEV